MTLLAGLSLAAAVAVGVLWARSYQYPPNRAGGDVLNLSRNEPLWWIISARGTMTLCRQQGKDWGNDVPGFEWAGINYGGRRGPNGSLYNLRVPHAWAVGAVMAGPLAWIVAAWRRRRRVRPGTCAACGYDLRATPDRCPECGSTAGAAPRLVT